MVATERAPSTRLNPPSWHGVDAATVAPQLGVDPGQGLSASEAADRLALTLVVVEEVIEVSCDDASRGAPTVAEPANAVA